MNILIIGATSAIANACARLWVNKHNDVRFFFVARNEEKLTQTADDLKARGANAVFTYPLDFIHLQEHPKMIEHVWETLENIDIVLVAHGSLPDQKECEKDVNKAIQEFTLNATTTISLLSLVANKMEKQGNGTIAVISSVAGDRGRPSIYVYGAAKAAVSAFCGGLRARMFKSGVHVLTIKPGVVATPMTQGIKFPPILVATPEKVAKDIIKAIDKKTNTLYTPNFWFIIMSIIRAIPENIFKRIHL